jgi:iron complex outermembrane recepter protein
MKKLVAIVAPMAALCIHGQADAQSTPAASAQPAARTGGMPTELAEVVVTAERRAQSVQESSLAIQVLSPEDLERVSRPQDLQSLVTGMQIAAVGPNPQVYIRGVGENTANSRTQNAVSWNLDGVYLPRGSIATLMFYDLERVEVLKGPQGTLYGRNSSGGAINLISRRPVLGEVSGNAGVEVGSFDKIKVEGALNIPLSDTLAVRLAGQVVDRDGYLTDGSLDQRTKSMRVRALWEPTERVSIMLNADYGRNEGQGSGAVLLPVQQGNPYRSMTDRPLVYPWSLANMLPYTTPGVDRLTDATTWSVNAELNFDLGPVILTVVPAFREQDQAVVSYTTTQRFSEVLHNEQQSLEVRLANESEGLQWVVGGYYFVSSDDVQVYPSTNGFAGAVLYFDEVEARAVFAQATVPIIENLRGIAGIRYTHEKLGISYQPGTGAYPIPVFVANGPLTRVPSETEQRTTYKLGLEYDLFEDSMLFATYSTGFKGGGFNASTACTTGPFQPEDVTAYELGMRNRFFGNSLQVNLEAFHWTYENQHVGLQGVDPCNNAPARSTLNVGTSTIKGANVDVVWRATANDTFSFAIEKADGVYDDFAFIQSGIGTYAASTGTPCSATSVGAGNFRINCSGLQVTRLAEWSGRVSYEHVFPLSNGGDISARASGRFSSETWLDIHYGPQGRAPSYSVFDADLTYNAPDGRYSVSLFVQNLTDEAVFTGGLAVPGPAGVIPAGSPGAGTRYYSATIEPPRVYGLRADVSF